MFNFITLKNMADYNQMSNIIIKRNTRYINLSFLSWRPTLKLLCVFLPCWCRCAPSRAGESVCAEAAPVLCALWLRIRSTERPEMEGGEAGGTQRDGGIHHTQQECHHWAHLPGGGAHGEFITIVYVFDQYQDQKYQTDRFFFYFKSMLNIKHRIY